MHSQEHNKWFNAQRFDDKHVFAIEKFCDDWYTMIPWVHGLPEGTRYEWLVILDNLEQGQSCSFKRLEAVVLNDNSVIWRSPRNSNGTGVVMPHDMVADFIVRARTVLQ